ncbi:alpha/beta hydrolase domain-containing protein [Blastococcus sp. CCUG 61487]|uniref:alpha/beta hydrolase domain-containing protein n=1 Tax=Blastococcus sp. CCUG 61487 TaxID=1840703 RepID=UPI0010C0F192|nr:alpha/beta hydrolase domain-containing protein [Blastococcus sp. CCUG 61487]TKJ21703.1 hypothetical protein A6V29_07125 [Blastococcus sp. CCUG 61487]
MTDNAGSPPLASTIARVVATTGSMRIGEATCRRTTGTVDGVVDTREQVAGLTELARDGPGRYPWSAEFEVILPEGAGDVVLVDAENRGRPTVLLALEQLSLGSGDTTPTGAVYPDGRGIGFLAEQRLGYARVQWETGLAAGVPATAQGVGQVVVRDLGRLLTGALGAPVQGAEGLPRFEHAILAGISQSAWFVTTLVAEGFNVDPASGDGVFAAALAVSGAGNWLALNQGAGEQSQRPYLLENGVPLSYEQVLTRPASDPLYVDVATYTDYYRLRASVTAHAARRDGVLRYDWPAPHAGPAYPDAMVFGLLGCNGGVEVPRNPIGYDPYLRTLVAGVTDVLRDGDLAALQEPAVFDLVPPRPGATLNELPGVPLLLPAVDDDTAHPLGGVRFPDAVVPLGRPVPAALGPLSTASITDVCGNWGGWQPFSADELRARYGDVEGYLARYAAALDAQIGTGHLRPAERERMLARARRAFLATGA